MYEVLLLGLWSFTRNESIIAFYYTVLRPMMEVWVSLAPDLASLCGWKDLDPVDSPPALPAKLPAAKRCVCVLRSQTLHSPLLPIRVHGTMLSDRLDSEKTMAALSQSSLSI